MSSKLISPREFTEIARQAYKAGQAAGQRELERCQAETGRVQSGYGACGGAFLILQVDGRTKLGRFLKDYRKMIPYATIEPCRWLGGFSVNFRFMTNRQEQNINVAAEKAALQVLVNGLGVQGYVRPYVD